MKEWDTRQKLLALADRMLELPLLRSKASKDGQDVIVMPARWSLWTTVEILKLASLLGRQVTGLPTKPEPQEPTPSAFADLFFDDPAATNAALPAGAAPPLPRDPAAKPPIRATKPTAGKGVPSQPTMVEKPLRPI